MFCDPVNRQRRLDLIEGLSRDFLNEDENENVSILSPKCINKLCLSFESSAIYWQIKNEQLKSLLSRKNYKIKHKYICIESLIFDLTLENKNEHIILSINPLNYDEQCFDRVYCELYCIETQTQFKRTHLFNVHKKPRGSLTKISNGSMREQPWKFVSCSWSEQELNIKQCQNKKKLTFCVYLNILDETQCQPLYKNNNNNLNNETPSGMMNITYKWDLDRYYKMPINNVNKIYSPNFGDDCWCLWFKKVIKKTTKKHTENKDLIIVGLQLLKLPKNYRKGILFKAKMGYQNNTKPIEFNYFLDLKNYQVEIGKIQKVDWIKMDISFQ